MISSDFQSFTYSFDEVAPTKAEIAEFIQTESLDESHPAHFIVDELLDFLSAKADNIRGGYSIQEIANLEIKEGKISFGRDILEIGVQIAAYLRGSSYAALFVCTAGNIFTTLSTKYNTQGDYLEAYIADAIGSLTVENAMDKIQEQLSQAMSVYEMKISNRYSPGYCNWALADQQNLFPLIGKNEIGVTLSASSLMTPIKSVSGLIGIGMQVKKRNYGCEVCNNKTCIYRKILNK